MGYNQTFEIIIKDIQDIEKLVSNFKNYSRVPKIELDLAMSKLRNVYDLMLLFRENDQESTNHEQDLIFENDVKPSGNPPAKEAGRKEEREIPVQKDPAPEAGTNHVESEKNPLPPGRRENTETPESGKKSSHEDPVQKPISQSPDLKEAAHRQEEQIKREKILSEQFEKRKEYINEKLGEKNAHSDLSSKLQSSPIEKIAGSMGINDKFFFIRELFGGDAEKFRQTMDVLDHSADFDAAWNYLDKEFDWDMESSTVRQLLNLLRRKFISG